MGRALIVAQSQLIEEYDSYRPMTTCSEVIEGLQPNQKEKSRRSHSDLIGLSVYPNPASEAIMVNCEDCVGKHEWRLDVVNHAGSIVHSQKVGEATSVQINTSEWVPGVYIVKVYLENESMEHIFVIE